jgi:hypothetical protein
MGVYRMNEEEAKSLGYGHLIPPKAKRASNLNEKGQNGTEARFDRRLADMKYHGTIRDYWFESVKFRLANRCWYCPDFMVEHLDRSKGFYEVKGTWVREDGWIKLKMAAEVMPFSFWLAVWDGKAWVFSPISARGSGHIPK